jgi:hypothetical protein
MNKEEISREHFYSLLVILNPRFIVVVRSSSEGTLRNFIKQRYALRSELSQEFVAYVKEHAIGNVQSVWNISEVHIKEHATAHT